MNSYLHYIIPTILFILIGCDEGAIESKNLNTNSIKEIPSQTWVLLGEKNIFFGHQSVGNNIINGIKTISAENQIVGLNIVDTDNIEKFTTGVFAHHKIGQNSDPYSKFDDFSNILNKNINSAIDIAFLKLCFVDIKADSDIHKIFNEYKATINDIKSTLPNLKIIHFTIPLTKLRITLKTRIKGLFGKKDIWEYDHLIKKNLFNNLIINEYSGIDPIFDIASIESTYPDGSRNFFRRDGELYYTLIPDYSIDGAHLNELGQRIVAEKLLLLLSNFI